MRVQIIADSACDLTDQDYKDYHIERVSLSVLLDGETYQDGQTISAKTIYDSMRDGKAPKTAQAAPEDFKRVFMKYAEENKPCLYLGFSSELSGTYQSATIAAQEVQDQYPNWQLQLVDTKCASLGYGLVVLRAAKLALENHSLEEITAKSRYNAEHTEHIFTVDDLEYLYRGGRVSKSAAFVGTLLKIKPLLHVDDGKLIPLEKIRGSKKVLSRMVDLMDDRGGDFSNQTIGISHGDALDKAEQLRDMIQERFDVAGVEIRMVGSTVGAHSGPGTLALFFSNDVYN
ncbi:EDD domain protein, DegV family [Pelagirhabdus alkalitolerans]|uniref:EDD domain protein, DegV family n=1 Tax=Pelagirhabdus alkalitolerans TaxID=1612202 RepID=A0A1G6KBI4_9BACI|nr:DegV family protein [Pelagirhabdus alkalitolerans]SDC28350.1 EDD domain protein, DegV family [Pelagirhabdus alkalitolerans]